MYFSLSEQDAIFSKWNPRSESHGEAKVPASDMTISFLTSSDVLSEFDSSLRHFIYRAPHPGEGDLSDQGTDEPTRLRFPKIKNTITWDDKIVGATVVVGYGTGGPSDIEMEQCTVDSFVFDPHEGGTVSVKMRIQCHPSSGHASKLYELQGNEITLSILLPEVPQGELLDGRA